MSYPRRTDGMGDSERNCREDGEKAYERGDLESDNPHERGTLRGWWWAKGYGAALAKKYEP